MCPGAPALVGRGCILNQTGSAGFSRQEMHTEVCAPSGLGVPTSVGKGAHGRVRSRTHEGVHSRWMSAAICTPATPPETSFSLQLIVWLFPEKLVCLARAETGALIMRGYATRTCRNGACCIWGKSLLVLCFPTVVVDFFAEFPDRFSF